MSHSEVRNLGSSSVSNMKQVINSSDAYFPDNVTIFMNLYPQACRTSVTQTETCTHIIWRALQTDLIQMLLSGV
jgi:hypothetical protein